MHPPACITPKSSRSPWFAPRLWALIGLSTLPFAGTLQARERPARPHDAIGNGAPTDEARNPRSPASANQLIEAVAIAPPPPDLGPTRPPSDPDFRPDAEPMSIQPASTAMGSLSVAEREFAHKAAFADNAQIAFAKLAVRNATSSQTRQMAQRLLASHAAAREALHSIVEPRGVDLPAGLDLTHQETRARLTKLSGLRFDREYVREALQDHVALTSIYRDAVRRGRDVMLRSWATQTLRTLEQHVQSLRDMSEDRGSGV